MPVDQLNNTITRLYLKEKQCYLWRDGPWHLRKEAEHCLRESLMWNIVLQQQHLLFRVLLSCASQTAYKMTLNKNNSKKKDLHGWILWILYVVLHFPIKPQASGFILKVPIDLTVWRNSNLHLDIWSLWASHRWTPWSSGLPGWLPAAFQCECVGYGGQLGWKGAEWTEWKQKETRLSVLTITISAKLFVHY